MINKSETKEIILQCSFCDKINSDDVFVFIAGLREVFICDTCVGLCNEMIYVEIRKQTELKQQRKLEAVANVDSALSGGK